MLLHDDKTVLDWCDKNKYFNICSLCTNKEKLILSMYNFMLKNKINADALIHDGLLIEKTNKIIFNDECLNTCSRYIYLETGYNTYIHRHRHTHRHTHTYTNTHTNTHTHKHTYDTWRQKQKTSIRISEGSMSKSPATDATHSQTSEPPLVFFTSVVSLSRSPGTPTCNTFSKVHLRTLPLTLSCARSRSCTSRRSFPVSVTISTPSRVRLSLSLSVVV
jgi:hypothetical protein